MSITTSAATVGTAAVLLISGEDYSAGNKDGRITYDIYNNGTATVYIGGTSAVTTATGTPIPVGGSRTLNLRIGATVYGISGTAGQNLRIMKVA